VRSCHSGLATERHCLGTGIAKKTRHCLRIQRLLQMRTIDHQCFQVKHLLLRIPGRCRLTASLGEAGLGLGRRLLLRPFAGSCWERCLRWLHRRLAAQSLCGWRPCPFGVEHPSGPAVVAGLGSELFAVGLPPAGSSAALAGGPPSEGTGPSKGGTPAPPVSACLSHVRMSYLSTTC